eukprot:6492333-Amphidinium_carterae.1
MARSRYEGPVDALHAILSSECATRDTAQIEYSDDFDSPIVKRLVVGRRNLVRKLVAIQPNVSFTQPQVTAAFKLVASEVGVPESHMDAYAIRNGRKLRCLCHHAYKSFLKARGRGSSWVHSIFSVDAPGTLPPAGSADMDSQSEQPPPPSSPPPPSHQHHQPSDLPDSQPQVQPPLPPPQPPLQEVQAELQPRPYSQAQLQSPLLGTQPTVQPPLPDQLPTLQPPVHEVQPSVQVHLPGTLLHPPFQPPLIPGTPGTPHLIAPLTPAATAEQAATTPPSQPSTPTLQAHATQQLHSQPPLPSATLLLPVIQQLDKEALLASSESSSFQITNIFSCDQAHLPYTLTIGGNKFRIEMKKNNQTWLLILKKDKKQLMQVKRTNYGK